MYSDQNHVSGAAGHIPRGHYGYREKQQPVNSCYWMFRIFSAFPSVSSDS